MNLLLVVNTMLLVLGFASAATAQPVPSPSVPPSIEVKIKSDERNPWHEWYDPSAVLGIIGVLGGTIGVLVQRYWHRIDERLAEHRAERDRLQAHVLDSLKWFEGKTQKRSIGLAVIEGNWRVFPGLRPTWFSVLTNQAVYLLAQSKEQDDAALEKENTKRIMALLAANKGGLTPSQVTAISEALDKNQAGEGLRGLQQNLASWKKEFP